ncbi:MBL fold metallo-hydrolase [Natronoarchaeum mannanilyticum]|uniref:MBL fold metallo-hydrolase n=3 Tax=Natronoarchaeum mannanilyticum TaxID=926360 RepID=A0AAV3TF75_9EURY
MQVHPIALDNEEFEGNNDAYLVEAEGATALIDAGVATPGVREQLEAGLADRGHSFESVDAVLLTHWHADHAGLAGTIQDAGGARVVVHEADAPMVRRDADARAALRERHERTFEEWGMPAEKREGLREMLESDALVDPPETVGTIADGDEIAVGDRTLRALHAPGHTAGLTCFEFETEDGREAFVGDAILPEYTPNVGGADLRVERPLEQYLASLRRIADREYERAWPGHRDVIEAPAERARTIIEHHRERTERVVDVLDAHAPADAWTVSAHLFGDLEGIHVLHGPGEAYAHLDHLRRRGVVERAPEGYRLLDGSPDLDAIV